MRLTNNLIMKTYLRNINKSITTYNKLSDIATTGQLYKRASENPAAALKAFNVRRDLSRVTLYKSNVLDVQNILTDVESSISALNDIAIEVSTKIEQAKNTTYGQEERASIAAVLKNLQIEILNNANTKYAGRYLFGGANITNMPFTVSGGKLLYNGVDVDNDSFEHDSVYIDLGMGMANSTAEANGNTAFDISYPGAELLGFGKDADGISNNMYNIIGDIVDMLESNDLTNLDKYAAKFENKKSEILIQYADIGQKSSFVNFIHERLEVDEENALTKQDSLESADLAEAIMNVKYQEASYNAALKMGASILQNSLLDYLK